jgi:putative transposase
MKTRQRVGNESSGGKDPLVGIEAKTGPYPAARSWSGGRRRLLGREVWASNTYHVMSRTCGGEVFFDDVEKEALRRLLWKMSEFCGVRLVTYCIMGNHFHALVEVPKREIWLERFAGAEGEEKLFEHLRLLYSKEFIGLLRQELAELRRLGMESLATAKLERIQRRFCDLSLFVKEVKERFSRWFNKRRERRGTLWMDRFKSVLVEGRGEPLHTMAAYIDLNPVRAGLVEDPKDYRWSGYGEAMGGSQRARRGLAKVTGRPVDGWEKAGGAEAYRCLLFSSNGVEDTNHVNRVQCGVAPSEVRAVPEEGGKLPAVERMRMRLRYFSEGLVLGGKAFVEAVYAANRGRYSPRRKQGARSIEVIAGWYALRRLRKKSVGEGRC